MTRAKTTPRRQLIVLLPGLAVAVVGWAFVTTLRPAPVLAARVYGGPCAAGAERSLLITLTPARGEERSASGALTLRVRSTEASGEISDWQGQTNADGQVELALGRCTANASAPELVIESESGARLAQGKLEPSLERWQAATRNGGWLVGQSSGALRLRVAPLEGTLAVPFAADLTLHAERTDGSAAPGVALRFDFEGAVLVGSDATSTDTHGDARVRIQPEQHAISLGIEAKDSAGRDGRWYGALPVVPGALHVRLEGRRLQVRSPIVRERAYLSLVDERARRAGAIVSLDADARGGAEGSVDIERLLDTTRSPLWAVVSSEPDKRSAAVVGWPIEAETSPPPRTFAALDQLLLDGLGDARQAERMGRQARRHAAALFAAATGLLVGALFVIEVRGSPRRAPAPDGDEVRTDPSGIRATLVVALLCLLLGLLALAWFGTLGAE